MLNLTLTRGYKDMNDLHLKPGDAMDCSKWKEMIMKNWNDSNSDSGA